MEKGRLSQTKLDPVWGVNVQFIGCGTPVYFFFRADDESVFSPDPWDGATGVAALFL
eukprot:CAMPEP_0178893024 /NCGR_PEP_ID=MMETSP0747-20121128/19804_1 /TAXON_ID=913974 /ORGANISM="Nitzschia punctata, Strain CCMP561" /LENGTH=56 /DNA_ID=CAMNT_0020563013 /DNA_START=140 /DNA_END=307 /DNA_ORIENTATION=-